MNIWKVVSQGLYGLALALILGAAMSASATPALAVGPGPDPAPGQCVCRLDSCVPLPSGGCCNGFCDCYDNCGCALYTPPGGIQIAVCTLVAGTQQ